MIDNKVFKKSLGCSLSLQSSGTRFETGIRGRMSTIFIKKEQIKVFNYLTFLFGFNYLSMRSAKSSEEMYHENIPTIKQPIINQGWVEFKGG